MNVTKEQIETAIKNLKKRCADTRAAVRCYDAPESALKSLDETDRYIGRYEQILRDEDQYLADYKQGYMDEIHASQAAELKATGKILRPITEEALEAAAENITTRHREYMEIKIAADARSYRDPYAF